MPVTKELFRKDSYLKTCNATITSIDERGIQFDQTVFYPHGGGQLGDTGSIVQADGSRIEISNTIKDKDSDELLHVVDDITPFNPGESATLNLDWDRRYKLMRFHSCLHMVCAMIDAPVNGGSIQEDRARLDFDLREPLDKLQLTEKLNALIQKNAKLSMRWISDEELAANPDLVRTMSVAPPKNSEGTIRLVEFEGIDLQACGGTHVASTGEIGRMLVKKIENKGKQNRRITVVAADA